MMKRIIALTILSMTMLLPTGVVNSQDLPPGPTTVHRVDYDVPDLPSPAVEIVQYVLDFAPGSFTPPHTHSGPTFVTVLDGTVTRRIGTVEDTFAPGQGWEESRTAHVAGNMTDANARVLVTGLLPVGVQFTTAAATGATGELPPGPRVVAQFRSEILVLEPGPHRVHHMLLDFAPGAITPPHTHGGPTFVTVLEGAMARRAEGIEETFSPGQTWVEPGIPHAAGNRTGQPAQVAVAFVVPQGHALTHVLDEPRASDGLGISTESALTRANFAAAWGERAAERWAAERTGTLATVGR
jgi:quercetin dioxygenase-like cupin family protein